MSHVHSKSFQDVCPSTVSNIDWGQAHKRSEEVVSLQKEKQEDSDLASVIQ